MKKGQVYEGSVVRVDFPNKGIVCVGDETAVVKNSLPGQKVKFSVNKVRKGKAEGRLLEVTEKSPLETGRTCSLFGLCGGCTYLSLPYEEQLKVKEEQVKRLLDSVLNKQEEAWAFEGIKGSPKAYEYRNKMELCLRLPRRAIAISVNFPSETSTRTDRWRWACIREAASTI